MSWLFGLSFINLFLLLLATTWLLDKSFTQILDLHSLWPPVRSQTSWRARLMMPWLALRAKPKCSINTGYRTSRCRLVVKLWGSRSYTLHHMKASLLLLCVSTGLAALLLVLVFFWWRHPESSPDLSVLSSGLRCDQVFPQGCQRNAPVAHQFCKQVRVWQCKEETSARWRQLTSKTSQAINLEAISNRRRFDFWNWKRPSIVEKNDITKFHLSRCRCVDFGFNSWISSAPEVIKLQLWSGSMMPSRCEPSDC